jgi:hypothetical protein
MRMHGPYMSIQDLKPNAMRLVHRHGGSRVTRLSGHPTASLTKPLLGNALPVRSLTPLAQRFRFKACRSAAIRCARSAASRAREAAALDAAGPALLHGASARCCARVVGIGELALARGIGAMS